MVSKKLPIFLIENPVGILGGPHRPGVEDAFRVYHRDDAVVMADRKPETTPAVTRPERDGIAGSSAMGDEGHALQRRVGLMTGRDEEGVGDAGEGLLEGGEEGVRRRLSVRAGQRG